MKIYAAVEYLKSLTSGFHWDDQLGMNIGPAEENAWNEIILQRPECKPFRNSGWEIFDDVAELKPEKAKGTE